MADDDVVLWEEAEGVATLTLNRPNRMNAWTGEMEARYFDLLQRASESRTVRAVVVTGAGRRGFCPGADMDILAGEAADSGGLTATGPGHRAKTFATTIPKIVVAAVNGACAGAGLALALCCDVRFAAGGAKWTTAFARRGLVAEYGSAWLLPRLIGTSRALDLLASGRVFTSEEALEIGLVSRVLPGADLVTAAQSYARDLAANCSPASMAVMKEQVYAAWGEELAEAEARANHLMVQSLSGVDFVEGVRSFIDRRTPAFEPLGEGTTFT